MKSQFKSRIMVMLSILIALALQPLLGSSDTHSQAGRYLRHLKACPIQGTSSIRIAHLLKRLVPLAPESGFKYFKIGIARLTPENARGDAYQIGLAVEKIMKKAGLPSSKLSKMVAYLFQLHPGNVHFTPTL